MDRPDTFTHNFHNSWYVCIGDSRRQNLRLRFTFIRTAVVLCNSKQSALPACCAAVQELKKENVLCTQKRRQHLHMQLGMSGPTQSLCLAISNFFGSLKKDYEVEPLPALEWDEIKRRSWMQTVGSSSFSAADGMIVSRWKIINSKLVWWLCGGISTFKF